MIANSVPGQDGVHHRTYFRMVEEIAMAETVTFEFLKSRLERLGGNFFPTEGDL